MKRKAAIRILSGLIDYLIVMIPVQFIMMGLFRVSSSQADLLFKLLFAVYGVLFIEYMDGKTPGKFFGKIQAADKDGSKPAMLYAGMREFSKTLYFIPYIGWGVGLISMGMIFFGKGRALHDYIGGTKVIFDWEKEEVSHEDGV